MNQIWTLVVTNLTGVDTVAALANGTAGETGAIDSVRDVIDGFCYTIVYTIFVYMLGMNAFKLIDTLPRHIMRWMGAQVQPYGADENAGSEFVGTAYQGLSQFQSAFGTGIYSLLSRNRG